MKNATYLVLQGPTGKPADLEAVITAAERDNGRVSVVHVGPVPVLPGFAVGAAPGVVWSIPEAWAEDRTEMIDTLTQSQQATQTRLAQSGLSGDVAVVCVDPSALPGILALRAMFADLCILQDSMRDEAVAFDNAVYGLLFEGPGPILLNGQSHARSLAPDKVMIAWNSSLPSARAVRAALPLLKTAKEVTIACFDHKSARKHSGESPGADLAGWLSHHGCRVTVQEYPVGGKSVADAIVDRARTTDSDLVVMGAYGRSRLNERLFGGTTLSMIQQTQIPVFMAH